MGKPAQQEQDTARKTAKKQRQSTPTAEQHADFRAQLPVKCPPAIDRHALIQRLTDHFPDKLKPARQWVVWKWGKRKSSGKFDKILLQPDGTPAKSNQPLTWNGYETVLATFLKGVGDGFGFVFLSAQDLAAKADPHHTDAALYADFRAALAADERSLDDYLTGLAGIDLDGCRNPETGSLTPEAQASVAAFPDWFWEVSPSGTGLHGMGFSDLVLDRGKKRGWVESYNTGRFFTVTADYYAGEQFELGNHTAAHTAWYAHYFPAKAPTLNLRPTPSHNDTASPLGTGFPGPDEELIAKAQQAKNGVQFSALWAGNHAAYPSQSEADLALCNHLTFWCGPDPERIDRLFRQSSLYRPKWDEQHGDDTYGGMTVQNALEGVCSGYV